MRAPRVLVVGADPAFRKHLRDNIFIAGYSALDADGTGAADAVLRDFRPALAVVDLTHPDEKLEEWFSSLKSAQGARRPENPLRLVALVAEEAGLGAEAASAAGADDYLVEPFCLTELIVRVDHQLGRVGGRAGLPGRQGGRPGRRNRRLSDLISGEQPLTLVFITLSHLERTADVGVEAHSHLAKLARPIIDELLEDAQVFWAGPERLVVLAAAVPSAQEIAEAVKPELQSAIEHVGLPLEVGLKVRAGVRHWNEGKASFLARVTGRLSHGGLPISALEDGPPVATAAVASRIDQREARTALRRLVADSRG